MGSTVFLLTNIFLIIVSVVMGLIFLVLPLPDSKGLKNYRISLKVLASAYFIIGILSIVPVYFGLPEVRLLSPIEMLISSLQAILFSFSLITLFNPLFMSFRVLKKHLFPVLIFVILWGIFAFIWGNPTISSFDELYLNATHPTVMLRIISSFFYIFQLIYLSKIFFIEEKKYAHQLDNFFADNYRLQLKWVRYCFYAALAVGIGSVFSFFLISMAWAPVSAGIYALFYMVFGLFYIQYPKTFIQIEKVIDERPLARTEITAKGHLQQSWHYLRQQVIDGKYYLASGVNIEEIAQLLKISRTSLSNLINKEEGVNFNTWINMLRIKKAKELFITNPEFTISQVAEQVGFTEQSNFSRQFKLITNQSPSEWRQQNRA